MLKLVLATALMSAAGAQDMYEEMRQEIMGDIMPKMPEVTPTRPTPYYKLPAPKPDPYVSLNPNQREQRYMTPEGKLVTCRPAPWGVYCF